MWEGFEYMFSIDNVIPVQDFDSSERMCQQNNAHLADIESTAEDDFLRLEHLLSLAEKQIM